MMVIEPIPVVPVGTRVTISLKMQNDEGRFLPNMPLVVTLDGERVRRDRTNEAGQAEIRISQDLPVGTHQLSVEFIGTRAYFPVTQMVTVTIRPIVLTIQTVPPLANLQFRLNGATVSTDETGKSLIEFRAPGTIDLEALPLPGDVVDDKTHAVFRRWGDSVFNALRTVEVRSDTYVEAGYIVSHRVGQIFRGLDGNLVDESRIDTITLKSSAGDRYTFEDGQPRWLDATRINRSRERIEATPILYSVESVVIDGSNTVNRYQQRFYVEPEATWDISLLLYFARIRVFDALLGFPVGDGIELEYPNGNVEHIAYGPDKVVSIGPMARGTYRVRPTGVKGMTPFTPIALSRDQDADLKVLTIYDMALAGGLGVVGALGLLFYGRPHLIKRPFARLRPARTPRIVQPEAVPALAALAVPAASSVGYTITRPLPRQNRGVQVRMLSMVEALTLEHLRKGPNRDVLDRRCAMILLSDEGLSPADIGQQVSYSGKTVRRYLNRYNREGVRGLFGRSASWNAPDKMPAYLDLLRQTAEFYGGDGFNAHDSEALAEDQAYDVIEQSIAPEAGVMVHDPATNGWHAAGNGATAEPHTNGSHAPVDEEIEYDFIIC